MPMVRNSRWLIASNQSWKVHKRPLDIDFVFAELLDITETWKLWTINKFWKHYPKKTEKYLKSALLTYDGISASPHWFIVSFNIWDVLFPYEWRILQPNSLIDSIITSIITSIVTRFALCITIKVPIKKRDSQINRDSVAISNKAFCPIMHRYNEYDVPIENENVHAAFISICRKTK